MSLRKFMKPFNKRDEELFEYDDNGNICGFTSYGEEVYYEMIDYIEDLGRFSWVDTDNIVKAFNEITDYQYV